MGEGQTGLRVLQTRYFVFYSELFTFELGDPELVRQGTVGFFIDRVIEIGVPAGEGIETVLRVHFHSHRSDSSFRLSHAPKTFVLTRRCAPCLGATGLARGQYDTMTAR